MGGLIGGKELLLLLALEDGECPNMGEWHGSEGEELASDTLKFENLSRMEKNHLSIMDITPSIIE